MKTCIEEGCRNGQFGGGYCKYHQYRRKMKYGDLYQPKTRKSTFPKESKKRKKENIRYLEQIRMFWEESVENKTNFCYFCGQKMSKRDNIHHLKGRIGDYFLDKEWWVNAHQSCHGLYHDMPIQSLVKEQWYAEFLARIREKDMSLWYKEQKKIEKSLESSEDMFNFDFD